MACPKCRWAIHPKFSCKITQRIASESTIIPTLWLGLVRLSVIFAPKAAMRQGHGSAQIVAGGCGCEAHGWNQSINILQP
jgi:hypothetical protein